MAFIFSLEVTEKGMGIRACEHFELREAWVSATMQQVKLLCR